MKNVTANQWRATMEGMTDRSERWVETFREVKAEGMVCDFVEANVSVGDGRDMTRQWIVHPGSVAIIALDDDDRIAVVHQYRHPVGMRLVEPPAGICDIDGESPLEAAQRELAEEACLAADEWYVLADLYPSPGCSDESLRVFLAHGLHEVDRPAGFELSDEESDMGLTWLALDEAVLLVRDGRAHNIGMVVGVMTLAYAIASGGIDALRPGDAPWLPMTV